MTNMNLRKLLPLPLLLLPFLSCDRTDIAGDDASSGTVSLAPRLVTANGQSLPRVDSILIRVTSTDPVRPRISGTIASSWSRLFPAP